MTILLALLNRIAVGQGSQNPAFLPLLLPFEPTVELRESVGCELLARCLRHGVRNNFPI